MMQSPLPLQPRVGQVAAHSGVNCQPSTFNRFTRLASFLLILSVLFWRPLLDLAKYAAKEELYSHVLLVPVISIYLAWVSRQEWLTTLKSSLPSIRSGLFPAILGFAALGAYFLFGRGWRLNDYLSIMTAAYVCFVAAGAVSCLGRDVSRQLIFPLCFLVFMIPFPSFIEHAIEMFFQYASATAVHIMFSMTGTPFVRDGLSFQLPGIVLRVAQECSGIRSTLVLFITALVAGRLFLRTSSRKVLLVLFVIPLAIVRNGFRILTIGMLCVYVDTAMIYSWIHRRGGPVFFAFSLLPFFGLLIWLWKQERNRDSRRQS
jgi:exosortase C (VPDSG-CTERM-specific)